MSNKIAPKIKIGRCSKCEALVNQKIGGGFSVKVPSTKVTSLYPTKRKPGSTRIVSLF